MLNRSSHLLTFVVVALTGLAMTAVTALPAAASHDVTPARVAGENRVHTAAEVARLLYPNGTDHALIAKAGDFPDALAGAPLAGEREAPVLLTNEDVLRDETVDALEDLGVSTVTLLGGPDAINEDVAESLRDRGYTVGRIFGETRFGTAAQITRAVQEANDNNANFPGGRRAVFVANGFRFPDALAAGPLAAAPPAEIPILLVEQDAVPEPTRQTIQDLNFDLAIIVGGTEAVSENVRQQLEDLGVNTDRVAGATRVATATEVAAFAQEFLDFDAETILLARGDLFADALAAGPLGGATRDPILLARQPDILSDETADYLAQLCGAIDVIRAVGGENAITTGTLNHAERAAQGCHDSQAQQGQTFIVSPQQPVEEQVGQDIVFSVGARYDDQDFTGPVDVALFPCENADVVGEGPDTFTDADADGHADGLGETDTGAAEIVRVNGEVTSGAPTVLRDVGPDEDGDLDVALRADAQDCTVIVFWNDVDDDGALDLDAEDTPSEPYGIGKGSWV